MTITLKQFSQFIQDFVNKNFVPLLVPALPEHQKCLDQWRQVSEVMQDIDKVYLRNLQNCLKPPPTKSFEVKDSKEFKKNDSSRPSAPNFGSFDNFMERKDSGRVTNSHQEEPRSTSTNGKEHSEGRNKSYQYTPSSQDFQQKLSLQSRPSRTDPVGESDGFQKLLLSFRKLCQTFESNHKKLLKQDHNLKQNMKVQLHQ